jgi:hypothetical protein
MRSQTPERLHILNRTEQKKEPPGEERLKPFRLHVHKQKENEPEIE